jgi:HAD superfamily hydrolase (TIGR01509 family)
MASFDLIIWDCDGCLVDSEVIASRVELEYLQSLGLNLTLDDYIDTFAGKSMKDALPLIDKLAGKPIAQVVDRTAFRQCIAEAFEAYLKPIEGLPQVLQALQVPMCIASGSEKDRITHSLKIAGIDHFFADNIFTSHEVEKGKPAPDVFLYAAQRMNKQPKSCLVIEDSVHGIHAAQAAGMTVFAYLGGSHVTPVWRERVETAKPDRIFDDMALLPNYIEDLWIAL